MYHERGSSIYNLSITASVKEEVVAVPAKSPVLFSELEAIVVNTAFSILSACSVRPMWFNIITEDNNKAVGLALF